ncbi:MAG TPA: methyltransferase domain-containing protein [Ktedonobacteraceae bacterium]|nr:methyltransferase domain-containing protein [Ktedonobacteraceae bacterium]
MTTQQSIDQAKIEAFLGKVLTDTSGLAVTVMASIGDRLGLFKELARGSASSVELASRTGLNERYVREWLGAMASAGYVEYDPARGRFTLPPEHIPILAQENGPFFFGGAHQMLIGMVGPLKQLEQAFREGGGVPQSAYDDNVWDGMERFTKSWFENLLTQQWIPAMPDVEAMLVQGARVADVGCGRGQALIKLAQTYPNSHYVGYDLFGPSIERATSNAQAAGVANQVRFQQLDVSSGLPEQYDIITTFDVVHDAVNPRGLLRAIHQALRPDGRYVCLEINSSDKLEENAGPLGSFFYSVSVLYCMTTSLAGHGEGLGTVGLPPSKVQEMCLEAGFSSVRRLPIENPFNHVFEIKP